MNASQGETASLIDRVRRVLREPSTLFEQLEVQLKPSEQQIPADRHTQFEEIALRTVTARVSLQPEEHETQTMSREVMGKKVEVGSKSEGASSLALNYWESPLIRTRRNVGRGPTLFTVDRLSEFSAWLHLR